MKILELANFSAGVCGVWTRVREESLRLAEKGHEVRVFSSNFVKGSNAIAQENEKIGDIQVKRFPARRLGGESYMSWEFEKDALDFSPEIIIAHSYRHTHTLKAIDIAKKLKEKGRKCKVFLVTHAPFARSSTRNVFSRFAVWLHDNFVSKRRINSFDKVITITKWEEPYLLELGLKKDKIEYIPNGIPEEFFDFPKNGNEMDKILFLGRIAPIKNIETVISAIPLIKDKNMVFEVVGPAEEEYLVKIKQLIKELNVEERVVFSGAIYDVNEKIKKIDSAKIFVLPSKSEGMPQSLVEAMARSKIVISSDNSAGKELVQDKKNGFLFEIGNSKGLADKIDSINKKNNDKIKKAARESVEKFRWDKIIKKIEDLF